MKKQERLITENFQATVNLCLFVLSDNFSGSASRFAEHVAQRSGLSKSTAYRMIKGQLTFRSQFRTLILLAQAAGFSIQTNKGVPKLCLKN